MPASEAQNLTLGTPVDIMRTGDGWYHCASWCGREVTVRGNFCAPCSWMDAFMCAGLGIPVREEIYQFEMNAPYRGKQIDWSLDSA